MAAGRTAPGRRWLFHALADLVGGGDVVDGLPRRQQVFLVHGQRGRGHVRRRRLAEQAVAGQRRLGQALVVNALSAKAPDVAAGRHVDRDVLAEVDRGDHQVVAAGVARSRDHAFGRHVPHRPDALDARVRGQHRRRRLFRVAREVGAADALLGDHLDAGEVVGQRLLDRLVALPRDVEVGRVEHQAHLALAVQRLAQQQRGRDAVAVLVGRHDRDEVLARDHAVGRLVHEHDLGPGVGRRLERGRGGRRIDRCGDDDAGLLRHHRLDVGHLLLGLEPGVGHGDHADAHVGELGFQRLDLRARPVVAAVVHDDRGRRVHVLDLLQLLCRQRHRGDRRRLLAVRAGDEDVGLEVLHRLRRVGGVGGRAVSQQRQRGGGLKQGLTHGCRPPLG